LWNSFAGTVVVEVGLTIIGIWLYLRSTTPRNRIGNYSLWGLIVVLGVIYAGNLFGPPPPDEFSIAVAGNALWLFVAWGYWVDANRERRK
jgi:hypothetical protein